MVSAVAGLGGVGKTSLAVQAGYAARERGWFPGGILFLDLHGYDDQYVQPSQALDGLLRAFGVLGKDVPPSVDERAQMYQSVLANTAEPVLVIADNASSEAQVRILVPGAGRHQLLVTSRHTLAGLDARLVDVTVLNRAAGEIYHEMGDFIQEARTLNSIWEPLMAERRAEEAATAASQAAELLRDAGAYRDQAIMLCKLGKSLELAELSEDAVNAYRRAVEIFHQIGDDVREARALAELQAIGSQDAHS